MALESQFNGVDDLNASWPTGASDPVSEGADNLRGLKKTIQAAIGGNGTRADVKYAAAVVLRTVAGGFDWLVAGVARARAWADASGLRIEAGAASGTIRIIGRSSGNVLTDGARFTAVSQSLYRDGALALETVTGGVTVLPGGATEPVLSFQTAAAASRGAIRSASASITLEAPAGASANMGPVGSEPVQVGATEMICGSRVVSGVATPTANTHAATKGWVDAYTGGIQMKASGKLTPPATTVLKGCTAVKGTTGRWTVTLTTPLTAVANGVVLATVVAPTTTLDQAYLAQAQINSTTSIEIVTREVNGDASFQDLVVSFLVLDLGV